MWTKFWNGVAPIVFISFSASLSADLNPSKSPIVIGKNEVKTISTILGKIPYPSQSTRSGAIATVGIVWVIINIG